MTRGCITGGDGEQEVNRLEWDAGMDAMIKTSLEAHQAACHCFSGRAIYSAHVAMPTSGLEVKKTTTPSQEEAKSSKPVKPKRSKKLSRRYTAT